MPVASISREPQILALHPSIPTNTVSEFIAYAEANPGKISMASGGNRTRRISPGNCEDDDRRQPVHVPYRGAAPALADLIGGRVQVMFVAMASGIEYVRAGKLRSLAVTTAMRSEALPDLPVFGDFVAGYESSVWYGLGAPRHTSSGIVAALNAEINAGLANSSIKAQLADLGNTPLAGSATDSASSSRMKPTMGEVIRRPTSSRNDPRDPGEIFRNLRSANGRARRVDDLIE